MGFIDKQGELAIPPRFLDAHGFHQGLASATLDGKKWGYVNPRGEVAIEPRSDYARCFSEGLAAVEIEGKIGFVDMLGRMVIPTGFELWRQRRDSNP